MNILKKTDYYKLIGIPSILILSFLTFFVIHKMSDLRIRELQINLQRIGEENSASKSLSLLAQYNKFKTLALNFEREENTKDYLSEVKLLATTFSIYSKKDEHQKTFLESLILSMVNGISFLIQAKPIQEIYQNKGTSLIDIGFFYQRKKQFEKAIIAYTSALSFFRTDKHKRAFIRLHRGFCFALLNRHRQALKDYERATILDTYHEVGITAEILSGFLKKLKGKTEKMKNFPVSAQKGKKYYKLMSFKKAIKTFNQIEKNKKAGQKVYFYRARTYEEMGETKKAIKDYEKTIKLNTNSNYAKKSYQRLYILGTYYESNTKIKKKSEKKLRKLGIRNFLKVNKIIEKVVDTEEIKKLPQNEFIQEVASIVKEKTAEKLSKPEVLREAEEIKILGKEEEEEKKIRGKNKEREETDEEKIKRKKTAEKNRKEEKKKRERMLKEKARKMEQELPPELIKSLKIKPGEEKKNTQTPMVNIITPKGIFKGMVKKRNKNKLSITTDKGIIEIPTKNVIMITSATEK